MDEVVAVVVTYNRKGLLAETLRAILRQSVPVQRIILIDNASTDGTEALLQAEGLLDHPAIVYKRLPRNTGGAGGFSAGMKTALETGFSWAWLMDDDVEPMPDCLEKLLAYKHIGECIHPRKRYPDGSEFAWGHSFDPLSMVYTHNRERDFRRKAYMTVNVGCFEGLLISRAVVDQIGIPDERYFITGDDTLYGYKASTVTNVLYVRDAFLQKKLSAQTALAVPEWKAFYLLRNKFYLRRDCVEWAGLHDTAGKRFLFSLHIAVSLCRLLEGGVRPFMGGVKGIFAGMRGMRAPR